MTALLSRYSDRPWFRYLAVFLVSAAVFSLFDLKETLVGDLLRPAIGEPAESGLHGALAVGLVLGFLFAVNLAFLRILPFKAQVALTWAELLLLFLAFFASFDLSYEFIGRKIGFLITQGAFTTVYISLISIAIACVIALAAALARLSENGPAYGLATFYISFFRGTPLLLQVYLIYLGLPQLGFVVDAGALGDRGAVALLRRLHGGDLPRRHPGRAAGQREAAPRSA